MKICLDAGHGGKDCGAVGFGVRHEAKDNLRYAKLLCNELRGRGHTVKMTREEDVYPSLNDRADMANDWGAEVFLSLHRNCSDGKGYGGEVLYAPGREAKCKELAEAINKRMNTAAGFRDRGAKCQSATVLKRTKMPAVTVEAGFVDNAGDNDKFDKNLNAMVKAIADSIEMCMLGKITVAVQPAQSPTELAAPSRAQFIEAIAQAALKHCGNYGIKIVSPIIAQACLESGYGTSAKAKYHNYFGLKYREGRLTCNNGYFSDGGKEQNANGFWTPITTNWFKFDSLDKGVEGYFQFINTDNYSNLKGVTDPHKYLELIHKDGYATTLDYVELVYGVLTSNGLAEYDALIKNTGERKSDMPFDYIEDLRLKPARAYAVREKTERILIHHFGGDSSVEAVHKYHISRGHSGIDYNIVVMANGKIVWGRGLNPKGGSVNNTYAKTKGFNDTSIAVAFQGDLEHFNIPQAQKEAGFRLIRELMEYYKLSAEQVLGHDEAAGPGYTDCPGKKFPLAELKSYLNKEIVAPIPAQALALDIPIMPALMRVLRLTTPYMRGLDVETLQKRLDGLLIDVGGIDGIFGPKTFDAVQRLQNAAVAGGRYIGAVDGIVGPTTWALMWEA